MEKQLRKRIRIHASKDIDIENALLICLSNNKCFLCKEKTLIKDNKLTKEAVVDHYHRDNNGRGNIRGLICQRCNIKEGKIRKFVESGISFNKLIKKYGKDYMDNINILYKNGGILPMEIDLYHHEDQDQYKDKKRKRRKIDHMDVD